MLVIVLLLLLAGMLVLATAIVYAEEAQGYEAVIYSTPDVSCVGVEGYGFVVVGCDYVRILLRPPIGACGRAQPQTAWNVCAI